MLGRTLSHYRIDEEIGSGGMGVVYRAHDLRLDRDVALKVILPGTLADESARRRFRREDGDDEARTHLERFLGFWSDADPALEMKKDATSRVRRLTQASALDSGKPTPAT